MVFCAGGMFVCWGIVIPGWKLYWGISLDGLLEFTPGGCVLHFAVPDAIYLYAD